MAQLVREDRLELVVRQLERTGGDEQEVPAARARVDRGALLHPERPAARW